MAATVTDSVQAGSVSAATTLESGTLTPTGANKVIYALVASGANSPSEVSAVKYASSGGSGGESLTKLGNTLAIGANLKASLWRLIGPSAASGTIHATYAGSDDERAIIGVAWQDADQTTPNGTVTEGTGTGTPTVNAASVAGDAVMDFLWAIDITGSNWTITVGAGQTSIEEIDNGALGGPYEVAGASSETASGTSTTMSWSSSVSIEDWGMFAFAVKEAAGGGGTVNTETLTDTLVVTDEQLPSAVRGRVLSDEMLLSDGPTIVSTIFDLFLADTLTVTDAMSGYPVRGRLGESTVGVTDQSVFGIIRNRLLESGVAITDEILSQVVGNNILLKVLTSQIDVADGAVLSVLRNRLLQDTIIVSEGVTEQYTTSNIVADDELTVTDSIVTRLLLTRLLGDSIDLSDSAIASIIGQNVIEKVLSDSITTADEAIRWMNRVRLGDSLVLTTDEVVKVMRLMRELTDAIDLADENLTALQRFIMLSDALSVTDSAVANVNPQPDDFVTPTIRIGFDQPKIVTGGYALV